MTHITIDSTTKLPDIRDDIVISEGPKEPNGSPTWTIHDPVSNQYYRIGWDAYEILSLFPFAASAEQVVAHVTQQTALKINISQVQEVIKFLIDNQLVKVKSESHTEYLKNRQESENKSFFKTLLHSYIFFRIQLFNPNNFLKATLPIAQIFFTKTFFLSALVLLFLSLFLTLNRIDEFLNTFQYFFNWEGLTIYAISIAFVKMFHELGHAYAAKRNGLDVTDLGVAFIVLYPILYTDTTDSWRMKDIKQRRNIGIAGIGAEFYLATLSLFLWHLLPEGTLKSIAFIVSSVSFVTSLLINLNPLMRLDGYYLFSDLIGIENLQERSFELAKRKMRHYLWGWDFHSLENTINHHTERFLIKFAYATWIYRFFLFLGIAILVYNIFPKPFGLILMLIELSFFIFWPILKEIITWYKGANPMNIKFNAVITLLVLSLLITAIVLPWHNTLTLPAILYNSEYQKVITPYDARIENILIFDGQQVNRGDTLITLSSPTLEQLIEITAIEIKNINLRLEAITRDKALIKEQILLEEEKSKLNQEYKNYTEMRELLTIKSERTGIVRDLNKSIHVGRWVSKGDPLLKVIENPTTENVIVHAYVTESQLARFNESKKGNLGYFYDQNANIKASVELVSISTVSHTNLPWEELSSRYGGSIAVDTQSTNENISHEPLYDLLLTINHHEDIKNTNNILRGYVSLKVKPRSFSSDFFKTAVALFNREFNL